MDFKSFSEKQRAAILWWLTSPKDAIICDGAVRSGKTLSMSLGFVLWAMSRFDGQAFAICGRTITSARRNVITPMLSAIAGLGFTHKEMLSKNYLDIESNGRSNRFYLFGGKDEASSALIQGITLTGVLLDEVALMPRSFVEQAIARCSTPHSKLWFNCNPENPYHWFYKEWIQKTAEKNALYLHFTMDDNPSLTQRIRKRYKTLYSGAFYDRFILGKWTAATGLVYPMFDESKHCFSSEPICSRYLVSCDYGTVNPSSFGLWGYCEGDGIWYRLKEYYYASRTEGQLRTDEEHYAALETLCSGKSVETVLVDPSAASFMECIRRHGLFAVRPADNNVVSGIRRVSDALKQDKLRISRDCGDTLREFLQYVWDDKGAGDTPVKEHDHAMDDLRYFVNYALGKDSGGDDFFVMAVNR